jgi:hypothetical protein
VIVGMSLLGMGGWYVGNVVIPMVKQQLVKPAP